MLLFQEDPDPIFLAILHEALEFVRDAELVQFRTGYRPSRAERCELDEYYADGYPDLAPLFRRRQLVRIIDRLLKASREEGRWYRLTDYHWLVLYVCLQTYCDLHNDGATATGDKVGPYEIERIDFDALVGQFFFDTDFLMGPALLEAEEQAPGQFGHTRQAWRIAAGLKPEPKDLRLVRIIPDPPDPSSSSPERPIPSGGYIGPYPLREPDDGP